MRSRPWCCRDGCSAAFRLTSWFYRRTWIPYRRLASRIPARARRENFLGYFGPLSLIFLLILWAAGLIFGFALLQYGAGEHFRLGSEPLTFGVLVYHSGETFFTLGYGDIIPSSGVARALAVIESGLGFAFSRRGDWLFADYLFFILPPRDRDFPARCAGGLASVGR